jgi:hypothetical protein
VAGQLLWGWGRLGHGLLGPGSGPLLEGQGWSWRTGELALQVSAATGLRGYSLGAPGLPQLAKGCITILNA